MGMKAEDIHAMVQAALPDALIDLKDLAGDNDHYSITVVSSQFQGKSRDGMGTKLHALQVTTKIK